MFFLLKIMKMEKPYNTRKYKIDYFHFILITSPLLKFEMKIQCFINYKFNFHF